MIHTVTLTTKAKMLHKGSWRLGIQFAYTCLIKYKKIPLQRQEKYLTAQF